MRSIRCETASSPSNGPSCALSIRLFRSTYTSPERPEGSLS